MSQTHPRTEAKIAVKHTAVLLASQIHSEKGLHFLLERRSDMEQPQYRFIRFPIQVDGNFQACVERAFCERTQVPFQANYLMGVIHQPHDETETDEVEWWVRGQILHGHQDKFPYLLGTSPAAGERPEQAYWVWRSSGMADILTQAEAQQLPPAILADLLRCL